MIRPTLEMLSVLLGVAAQFGALNACEAQTASGCQWNGPPVEWILARHPPSGEISGSLGLEIIPFFQRNGIPVSFLSTTTGGERIRLTVVSTTTMAEVLSEIVQQAPEYRYRSVDGRLVVYPKGELYDAPLDIGQRRIMTRASASFFVLGGLREGSPLLHNLDLTLRGHGLGWGKMPDSDMIEVGGSRSLVEHLVSLVQKRPSGAFRVITQGTLLSFSLAWTGLVKKLDLEVPPTVRVGETFNAVVSGTLDDGTVVPLVGPDCEVSYAVSNPEVLTVDDLGRTVALKRGVASVAAEYEHREAKAPVHVE